MTENINEVFYRISDNVDSSIYDWKIRAKTYEYLETLKKQLLPTVEMTALQKAQMLACKEVKAGFSTFMFKQGAGDVPAFNEFITTTREDELMYAWLHPETIKVKD